MNDLHLPSLKIASFVRCFFFVGYGANVSNSTSQIRKNYFNFSDSVDSL